MTRISLRQVCSLLLLTWLLPLAYAQSAQQPINLRVGAVLSLTGEHSSVGRAQEAALRAWQMSTQTSGFSVEILTADDGSDPEQAAAQAAWLTENEVHALLCCATGDALAQVLPIAQDVGVLTLTLSADPLTSDTVNDPARNGWLFSVAPDAAAHLSSIVTYEGSRGGTLALMGLAGEVGDAALSEVTQAGIRLVAEERYPPDVRLLTPEALWIATRQPGAVLIWGQSEDTKLALSALALRGFEGRTYINPQVYEAASALERADLRGAFTVTDAISVEGALRRTQPTYQETRRFISALGATSGANRPTVEGGYVWDAVTLLQRAFEQTLAYTPLSETELTKTRQALRDSLVGLGPISGAAAVYDYLETDHQGIQANSLVVARLEQGQLRVAP